MTRLYKTLFICVITSLMASCGCEYRLKKARQKCGFTTETTIVHDTININKVETDTLFKFYHTQKDTTIIRQGRLEMRYFYNTKDSTIFLSGKCDSLKVIVEKTITNNIYKAHRINWNWLIALLILVFGVLAWFRIKK